VLRSLLSRPLLRGRRRDTAALLLLLTQDARPRLGMVPAAATTASDRECGRRRRRRRLQRRRRRRRSRVFEIVEQVVELAVPFSVAERRRARLKRRHRRRVRCPRCLQRGREGARTPTDVHTHSRARALARPGFGAGEYLALTHPSLGHHTRSAAPSFFPSARVCRPHKYHSQSPVRYVCPCLERFACCQ